MSTNDRLNIALILRERAQREHLAQRVIAPGLGYRLVDLIGRMGEARNVVNDITNPQERAS